ncbi:MAG: MFS transporter [Marmoricola sp.]
MNGHDGTRDRLLLGLAAVAVAFAAADTYVVVLALPDMMGSVGLGVDQLQRAAPIISGFLLGYVAMLPLVGRVADLRGRVPVLGAALLVFALGSLVTAAAYDLPSLVAGRFLQGLGGGGLVPVTMALVADLYPVERRTVPLGVVGAVQELGSVLGPLYGAAVLVVAGWRDIFWINLAVAVLLAAGLVWLRRRAPGDVGRLVRRTDPVGLVLLVAWLAGLLLVMRQPTPLVTSVAWGSPFVPFGDPGSVWGSIWWSPLGLATIGLGVLLLLWCLFGGTRRRRPVVDLRGWWASVRTADLTGAVLLAVALAGVILAFATADPRVQVFSAKGRWYLGVGIVAAIGFAWHGRRTARPLVPHGALAERPAWGALLVSFFTGAALIAALVDVPVFARLTAYPDSQVRAALVLLEFLVAVPIGALAGGVLARRLPAGPVATAGMACATAGFLLMSGWDDATLHHTSAGLVLALTGLGFGLAIAPVNAVLLAATESSVHGLASALLVVARMVGMLVGVSALTTIGLRRYYAVEGDLPSPHQVCGATSTRCHAYTDLLQGAGIGQLHAVFVGAAVCAALAGILAVGLFGGLATRRRTLRA